MCTRVGMANIAEFVGHRRRVGFDSNVLIALFEDTDYSDQAISFFDAVRDSKTELWTSVMTVPEVLIRPTRLGKKALVRAYEQALFDSSLFLSEIKLSTSQRAVTLANRYALETRDALHIASLIEAHVEAFVTADRDFVAVTELDILILPTERSLRHR